jgi:hypothetical protein
MSRQCITTIRNPVQGFFESCDVAIKRRFSADRGRDGSGRKERPKQTDELN